MVKKIISVATAFLMLCCMVPFYAFAESATCPKCGKDTLITNQDISVEIGEEVGLPLSLKRAYCSTCHYAKYEYNVLGVAGEQAYDDGDESHIINFLKSLKEQLLGKNSTATKFTPGGGSTSGDGVGRPKGYADDNGTPSVSSDGGIIWQPTWDDVLDCNFNLNFDSRYYGGGTEYNLQKMKNGSYNTSTSTSIKSFVFSGTQLTVSWNYTDFSYASNGVFSESSSVKGIFKFKTPIRGYYSKLKTPRLYFKAGNETLYYPADTKSTLYDVDSILSFPGMLGAGYFTNEVSSSHHVWQFYMPQYKIIPFDSADKPTSFTNITINNNTWNGNIYTDNSTNLTYIYPQYTTVNEKNETVTNISNTPIIYNNETKKYYTYDTVTNNYYYITYEQPAAPTPSPSPSPAPTETPSPSESSAPTPTSTPKPGGSISTPETGKPGGDTGDTTGILAVLVEIRDNMIQGFLDIKAAFVAGFAELSANFTLAIENLNLNITNIFNKKFPDQSTPETAPPSPSPSPSPSPAPLDPILPETQNLIIPKMNSNTFTDEHGTWIASGSSKYSDVFDFFRAFDRSTSEIWETNVSPSHLQIEIPDPENYYVDGYIMRISKFDNRYAKDWTLQGSDDGKTWDDLDTQKDQNLSDKAEHKYALTLRKAYKYYRLNMSNYASSMCSLSHFNLLGYDAKDVVTPTPAPTDQPSPSPAPDLGKPDSGDKTNNFWTIIFPNGGGSEDGKKGIFWALVSLILALIAFFANLAVGVGYLFPFLPDGVVMTINTCLIVIFLFTIIKFIMRSK